MTVETDLPPYREFSNQQLAQAVLVSYNVLVNTLFDKSNKPRGGELFLEENITDQNKMFIDEIYDEAELPPRASIMEFMSILTGKNTDFGERSSMLGGYQKFIRVLHQFILLKLKPEIHDEITSDPHERSEGFFSEIVRLVSAEVGASRFREFIETDVYALNTLNLARANLERELGKRQGLPVKDLAIFAQDFQTALSEEDTERMVYVFKKTRPIRDFQFRLDGFDLAFRNYRMIMENYLKQVNSITAS